MRMYAIPNCDTVRKARAWLDARGLACEFHDYKKEGVPADALNAAAAELGWPALIHRRGPTWRKLDAATQARAEAEPLAVLQAAPSAIRRPLLHWPDGRWTVGFDAAEWLRRA